MGVNYELAQRQSSAGAGGACLCGWCLGAAPLFGAMVFPGYPFMALQNEAKLPHGDSARVMLEFRQRGGVVPREMFLLPVSHALVGLSGCFLLCFGEAA